MILSEETFKDMSKLHWSVWAVAITGAIIAEAIIWKALS